MGALEQILKAHTDNGGDLRSVPIELLNDAVCSDQRFTAQEHGIMYMLVCQKRDYNKNSERVTSLRHWIETYERRPTHSRSDGDAATDSESELSIYAEIRAEERKLWRWIAGKVPAKVDSEERERWRRIDQPSPSPEVDVRKRKR